MRVCFLVPDRSRSGGIDVVEGHARRLAEAHGATAEVLATSSPQDLAHARAEPWDVALATWWTTIAHLRAVPAARRGVVVQGYDPLHYRDDEIVDRLAATAALAAPYDVVAVSDWAADMVRALRPEARCHVVVPGIDKQRFGGPPRASADGPLRVLVEGQPTLWFKGVAEALEATRAMRQAPHVTFVAPDPAGTEDIVADRVLTGLDAAAMAAVYREADVVLKLSRFEGLGLAPVEAFHAGVPCVVTPYGGHREYVRDGVNGIVVGFDDVPATVRALDRLDADRALLAALSAGALETASSWPSAEQATERLAPVLGELGPGGDGAGDLLDTIARETAAARPRFARMRHTLADHARAMAHEHARVAELEQARADQAELVREYGERAFRAEDRVHELADELETATSSKAYRWAIALRSLLPGRRG